MLLLQCLIGNAHAAKDYAKVQIVDPYIELRTGPGRGFPVFYVVERGEWLELLKRRTDWFKVRAANNKEGWVDRAQLENTLTEWGVERSFRDVFLDETLRDRVEVGFAGGSFGGDTELVLRLGAKLTPNFNVELATSQISGKFSSTSITQLNLLAFLYPDDRVSPFFTLGIGAFRNVPKATLVNALTTESTVGNAGLGVRALLTKRFMLRAEFRQYVVPISQGRIDDFREWTFGVAVKF